MAKMSDQMIIDEVFAYITENQYCYLATALEKQPKIRPMVLFYYNSRFFMVTFTNDSKVAQFKGNKLCEVCIPINDEYKNKGYIKMTGQGKIIKDYDLKYDATQFCYFFDELYEGADDPDFALIELTFNAYEIMSPGETFSKKVSV
ncbi:MAG: pyridoxamine 5'-phosphate oxidase family protein [Candidatus Cloacimonetes bacterium]|nr:pyridoxamine 5'-phosphate oxidase family protein [Candidatus Cloacimonadota bacterium]